MNDRPTKSGSSTPRVAVRADDGTSRRRAEALAGTLGARLIGDEDVRPCDLVVSVGPDGLTLLDAETPTDRGMRIDYASRFIIRGRLSAGPRDQPIARAVSAKRRPVLVDATAGLGFDAVRLRLLGCEVSAIERNGVVFALLADAIERARQIPVFEDLLGRGFDVRFGDSVSVLRSMPYDRAPDVVFLDPMFHVDKTATALNRKALRLIRELVGEDADSTELFDAARKAARRRVVVKRPDKSKPLAPNPNLSIRGKTVRYDVYLSAGAAEPDRC